MGTVDYRREKKVVYDGRADLPLNVVVKEVPKHGVDFTGPILMARRVPGFPAKCPICRHILKLHPRYRGIGACYYCPRLLVVRDSTADFWRDKTDDPNIYHMWVKQPAAIPGEPHRGVDISWHGHGDPCVLCALHPEPVKPR